MEKKSHIQTQCYHCGDECLSEHIVYEKKDFCCTGCKLVYDILKENNLCSYYSLEKMPGNTGIDFFDSDRFNYLDLDEVKNSLISFEEGKISKVNFYLPKIHCSSCIWLLENLQKIEENIHFSRVNFGKKEVSISYNNAKTTLRKVVELLVKIGYEPQISIDNTEEKSVSNTNRHNYIQLGIVSFCFGNMMLLSFPEYISFGMNIGKDFQTLFNYLTIIFSLPVAFYSIKEYIIPSIKSLKTNQISIDVPISIGIIALFFTSLYEIIVLENAGYLDSFGGLIFFLLLGKLFQQRTYDSLSFERDYRSYFPISVNKITKLGNKVVTLKNLVIGDEIEIHNEELIPVDCYLNKGEALVDYSFISGESEPVVKHEGDKLYAGGKQIGSTIQVIVEKEFSQSKLISLWNNEIFSKNETSIFDDITTSFSKYFTISVILIAFGSLLYWLPQQGSIALQAFVSVLIVACPCALALSSPFALGSLMRVFGKGKFFLKNALISEKMSKVDAIVFDKTGTLTNSSLEKIQYSGNALTTEEKSLIYAVVQNSTHPLSRQLYLYFYEFKKLAIDHFEEVTGKGLKAYFNDIEIRIGSDQFVKVPNNTSFKTNVNANSSTVHVSIDGIYKGAFWFVQNYRTGILETIKKLSSKYDLYVLSGDNDGEANTLKNWFGEKSNLHFNQTPKSKLSFIESLQLKGKKVMMIGDGLNDAGALKISDVGIALTDDITSFSPSSDGILEANSLVLLSHFLKISKLGIKVIKLSFIISILYNVIGLMMAIQGLLTPVFSAILMPLSSISVVLFTTISVSLIGRYYNIGNDKMKSQYLNSTIL